MSSPPAADRLIVEYEPRVIRIAGQTTFHNRTARGFSVLDGFGGRTIGEALLAADGTLTYAGEQPERAERVLQAWLEHCAEHSLEPWPAPPPDPTAIRAPKEIPLHAVRDLLGLVRAMFRAAKSSGAPASELARYERVGRDLKEARAAARKARPGSGEYDRACKLAERGAIGVGDLVSVIDNAEPIVRAAVGAVERRGR